MNRRIVRDIFLGVLLTASLVAAVCVPEAEGGATERAGDILFVLIPAAAYGTAFFLDDNEGEAQFLRSLVASSGVTLALKLAVNKERPDGSGDDSFPSLHTSVAFQGAAFIQKRYGWRYAIPVYAGAVFTGYSRVHARKHYAVDVAAGAAVGILSGYCLTTMRGTRVAPVAGNGFYGLSVSRRW
ncbi:MAG: phosphatase PAP2 family protein [Nitrospirae bacterium]|nr:phosphatase PAP2 family protein [Nitrospirota bacterium]